jgi:protein CpxP
MDNMKHFARQLVAAAVLATLGLAAVAQTPPAPQPAPADSHHDWMGRMMDPAKMQERMQVRRAARMAHFKEVLQITPAQEGAWTAWTASMQPPANWKRPDRAELEGLATPERIDRMRALRADRNAMTDRRADSTKTFYATLNPVQKRVFDLTTAHAGKRHGGGWGERQGSDGGEGRHHWN